jgi:hypothetical protein
VTTLAPYSGRVLVEAAYFRGLGAIWLKRAEYLDSVRADGVHWLSYEDLVNRPSVAANRLADTLPRLRTMILDTEIAVKDYPPQNIRNMNVGPLAALTERQKQRLLGRSRQTRVLSRALVMK